MSHMCTHHFGAFVHSFAKYLGLLVCTVLCLLDSRDIISTIHMVSAVKELCRKKVLDFRLLCPSRYQVPAFLTVGSYELRSTAEAEYPMSKGRRIESHFFH